jgi:hypothetical protein
MEELFAFLFEHMDDEQDDFLLAGIDSLEQWQLEIDDFSTTEQGYTVDLLPQEAITSVNRTIEYQLLGVALNYELEYSPTQISNALFVENWGEISDDTYDSYERSFDQDPSCLLEQQCLRIEYDLQTKASWFGDLIQTSSAVKGQIRWVDSPSGWVFLQRFWLVEPAEMEPSMGLDFHGQYYIHIAFPVEEQTLRSQAMWFDVDYGDFVLDEDWGKNQFLQGIKDENEVLRNWLEEQD